MKAVKEKLSEVVSLHEQLDERDRDIDELHEQIEERDRTIADQQRQLLERKGLGWREWKRWWRMG